MRKTTLIALALLAVVACNKEENKGAKHISVKAGIGEMTKVAYDGNKAAFVAGDDLAFFAWTGDKTVIPEKLVVNNVTNTLNEDGLWVPAIEMLWQDMVTPHYFMAVSPTRVVESFTADPYTLDPAAAKYQESDLLIAVNDTGLKANDNPVGLVFDHAMATLNVNLAFHNQWTEGNPPSQTQITEAKIKGISATAKDHATIDYISKAVTATGEQAQLAMNKIQNANWTVLMVPQTGFRTLTIELEGNDEWLGGNGTYVFNAPSDITLASGKITTVSLIIGRDQITLAENGITITDWTTQGDPIPGEVFKPQALK